MTAEPTIKIEDAEAFLKQFYQKKKVFGLIFRDDRGKNRETLLELSITPKMRESIVLQIEATDYVSGP